MVVVLGFVPLVVGATRYDDERKEGCAPRACVKTVLTGFRSTRESARDSAINTDSHYLTVSSLLVPVITTTTQMHQHAPSNCIRSLSSSTSLSRYTTSLSPLVPYYGSRRESIDPCSFFILTDWIVAANC